VVVSALLPSKRACLQREPASIHQQPHHDLRVHPAFLGVPDLAQVVLLLGLKVQRRDVVQHQGHIPAGAGVREAQVRDLVAVLPRRSPTQGVFHCRVAGRDPAQVPQDPAGVQQRGRLHDPGDHQVREHLVPERVEPQRGVLAACVDADIPEATRLAATIERWWPEIEGFLELGKTNARTEGYNRVIKQIKRVACGFRNQDNYERRIMLHSAALRAA